MGGLGMGCAIVCSMIKPTKQYQARLFLTSPGTLLGGSKSHNSDWFDSREDAEAWLKQAVEANNPRNLDEVKIQGRIVERKQAAWHPTKNPLSRMLKF